MGKRTTRVTDIAGAKVDPNTVLVCSDVDPVEILRLATEQNFTQIVQEGSPHHESEMKSSIVMMDSPPSFFAYPLSTILSPDSVSTESEKILTQLEIPFLRSDEKQTVLAAIDSYLDARGCRASLKENVQVVADELFTNAIFNAGFSKGAINRNQSVVLQPDQVCRMIVGADKERLVIVCEDLFGSLNIPKLLLRIKRCYEEGANKAMNFDTGGAGIGSYMIFDRSMNVYYGVRENEMTLIACVFPIGKIKSSEFKKNIHFVIYDSRGQR